MSTETLNIKCVLTDEELLELSKDLSEHLNRKKTAEDNLASFSAQLRGEIKGHDAVINKNAQLISAGYEYRYVKCEVRIDEPNNTVYWIRLDTNEIAQTERPIPDRFLQKRIEFDELKEQDFAHDGKTIATY